MLPKTPKPQDLYFYIFKPRYRTKWSIYLWCLLLSNLNKFTKMLMVQLKTFMKRDITQL